MDKTNPDNNKIPDINITDLDSIDDSMEDSINTSSEDISDDSFDELPEEKPNKTGIKKYINIHTILIAVIVISVLCIFFKFRHWGTFIDQADIERDDSGQYLDVLDQILPLLDEDGQKVTQEINNIVLFGNSPFTYCRDDEDGLANMLAKETGANIYNCGVNNSYLASKAAEVNTELAPMDAYTFYQLATLGALKTNKELYPKVKEAMPEAYYPVDADYVYDTLLKLDFNDVDVVVIMYDAADYLIGSSMYNDDDPTNIQFFTGNLEAGIEVIQNNYPNIRIIVLSPTYALAIDENGEFVSSDMYTYGNNDVLSTYAIKEFQSCANRSVTFIDNIYGTVTEANYADYLVDNYRLNAKGRKLVMERLLYALNYYNE